MKNKATYLENPFDLSSCCGCRACEQACSKNAITMRTNREGFLYPFVDESLCVNCGVCATVCPFMNSDSEKKEPLSVYAAINSNLANRKNSSSGGVFSALAQNILLKGGSVYGAAFEASMDLSHQRVSDVTNLTKLMGSKYIQSDTKDVFRQVKQDLTDGMWVLFSGTPCQVAGLKLFLRKDYERLMTIDIVCHGTPSVKVFKVFLNELEKKYKEKIVDFKFRDKRVNGWSCTCSCVTEKKDGKRVEKLYDRIMNAYTDAFLSGNLNRECCYKCPFAEKKRVGDFTLADYWGVYSVFPKIDYRDGVSILTINSLKGQNFLATENVNLQLLKSDYETAAHAGGNAQMLQPSIRRPDRDGIYEKAFSNPHQFINSFYRKKELKRRFLFSVKRILKRNETLYNLLRTLKR